MFVRGGKDVVEGIQSTYAKVQPNKALTLKGENLIHVICKNCGTVVCFSSKILQCWHLSGQKKRSPEKQRRQASHPRKKCRTT